MKGLLSELEAVNRILAIAGDSPVQTLEDNYVQSNLVRQILHNVSRTIQSQGWWFNEEENIDILPNDYGYIVLGTNVIRAVPSNPNIIQRGSRLYDKQNRTGIFSQAVNLETLVIGLEWDDLPNSAREYIVAVACLEYNSDYLGDDTQMAVLQRKISLTEIEIKSEDVENRQLNVFNNPRVSSIAFKNRRRGI